VFHVFNWTFISFIQSILLFLIAAPVYTVLLASTIEPKLTSADVAYMAVELGLVLTEYIADGQQWSKFGPLDGKRKQKLTHLQPTNPQNSSTKSRARSLGISSKRIWTAASSPRASGDTAGTPTLRPSSPSGSSCTSGAATRPRRCTTGPASGLRS